MKKTKDWFKNNYSLKGTYIGISAAWFYFCILTWFCFLWNIVIKERSLIESLTNSVNFFLYINYCAFLIVVITIIFIMFFTLPIWIMHIFMFNIPEKRRLKEDQKLKNKKSKEDIIQRDILRHANKRTNFTNN